MLKHNPSLIMRLILAMAVATVASCTDPQGKNNLEQTIHADDPGKSAIHLQNTSSSTVKFTMKLNGMLFVNDEDLKFHVEESKTDSESVEVAAWRFIKDHTYFEEPLTDTSWIHGPTIFINSLGFGYCDDKASALAYLWENLGLFSRVWSLGGHVVPEVHDGELWRMYDPEYEVFYRLSDNSVASVVDLMKTPALIRYGYGQNLTCNNIHGLWNRYSYKTADIYYTADNNKVNEWYSEPLGDYKLDIVIPPGGSFDFPGKFEPTLLNYRGDTINSYANAKLTIPKSWSGEINIPLVIHTIRGNGLVEINEVAYEIGSGELNNLISSRRTFIHELTLTRTESNLEIIYLINPLLTVLKPDNKLQLNGAEVSNVQVEIVELSDTEFINRPDQYVFPAAVYDIKSYVYRLPKYAQIEVVEIVNIYSKLMLLVTSNKSLDQEQMTMKYNLIKQNTQNFFADLSPQVNKKALLNSLNDDVNFALFISLMEHVPTDELARIINNNTNLKNHGTIHESGI